MKILVIGDSCKDIFIYGKANRLCPEAPVPVINYTHTITKPGMAANVEDNLKKLGKSHTVFYYSSNFQLNQTS